MKPFEDLLPEEKEPQHKELITFLQRAYRKPVIVPPAEQAQIITQVRERLMKTDPGDSLNEDRPVPQVGVLVSSPRMPVIHAGILRRDGRRFRLVALLAAALVIAVLLSTSLLLLRLSTTSGTVGLPTLTLSSNVARIGDTVTLQLKHFSHAARVALTHDIQEPVQTDKGSSVVTIGSTGVAIVKIITNSEWGPGYHLIVAEDVSTRTTASATLQIKGLGQTRPPRLLINTPTIDLGPDVVGANTIHLLTLANEGDGSITWSASSNQSWLLISPAQGTFSQSQTISIAAQRTGLKPGNYKGTINISSNVHAPLPVEVDMSVLPLSYNPGPVLALSPALLSFTATDGGANPAAQFLAVSNPGTQPLHWSLAINDSATVTTQATLLHALGPHSNWLSASALSGTVAPGATSTIQVIVQSQKVLPGAYIGTLQFTASGGAIDSPQAVNVSLTVQPHCGIVASSGSLSFTAVGGQGYAGNQTLSLSATVSCAGAPINWTTSSAPSWLTVTPASGQLKGTTSAVISLSVNAGDLAPNTYDDVITFSANQGTQTVAVQLKVQPSPPPAAPIMGASPLTLNFNHTQGQPNPTGQVVTITNNGGSPLRWSTSVVQLGITWLDATPTGGILAPGQTGRVTINVDTSRLTPGNYVGQVTLNGLDSSGKTVPGSPQTITINLLVQPPCSISQPSSSSLSFSADQGSSANPASQTVIFMGIGSCAWPVSWNTNVVPASAWLTLSPPTGTIKGTGQASSVGVGLDISQLVPGTYKTSVTISATDASGATVQGSPQTFTVTLTILPPCTLSPLPASLTFSVAQGAAPPAVQNVALGETGTCARPVTWTATGDAASSAWLVLSPGSGTDSGSGSPLGVEINPAALLPGTYSGNITITATDSTGAAVLGTPQTIAVLLTVTATISGSVIACSGPTCTTSQPLPGATVTLTSGTTTIATTTADASGNYTFSNVAPGSYTISASGTEANNVHYVGSTALTVSGNVQNLTVQVFPG